ncbi:MAG: ATP-binding protein [Erythrobacter sp.]
MECQKRLTMHADASSPPAAGAHDDRVGGLTDEGFGAAAPAAMSDDSRSAAPVIARRLAAGKLIASGRPDLRCLAASLLAGVLYALVAAAILCPQQQATLLVGLWPPNACVAALLLRHRFANEWLVLAAVVAAGMAVQLGAGFAPASAAILTAANGVEMLLAVALTRQMCGGQPDMTRLAALSRFIWSGGIAAPLASAMIASLTIGGDPAALRSGVIIWFLTGSMAMILIVPSALLLLERRAQAAAPPGAGVLERLALLTAGMICALLVFRQSDLPLMFLIPPITLLHAFRLGVRGTAAYVLAVAVIATAMTIRGYGPIAGEQGAGITQILLLQVFVSANFLTGLPVAAILASRAEMTMRLAEGKRQRDMLANNIADGVLHYDLSRRCTYASPSVRDVLAVPPESLVGILVDQRLHPETADYVKEAIDRIFSGQTRTERLTYRRFLDTPAGEPAYLEADCRAVHEGPGGSLSGVVVAVRDVTERIALETELTHAREAAEQVARLKSEFLANMSHEIRTPMNGVLGFAEMMIEADLPPAQRRYAELIVQSGRSMMLLLNDILDLSKIEAGQFSIDESPVDLHATLSECAELHRPDAERKGLLLRFECECGDADGHGRDPSLRHWVITDGLRLRQIVLNLLGNAVKFTHSGMIRLAYRVGDESLSIVVEDSGIGIAEGRLEEIFAPFNQGGGAVTRQLGGTGLGLSISRKLADLLGGNIAVESRLGSGSRFVLTLPAKMAPPQALPAVPNVPATPLALPPAARVLLAEDHDANRLLMSEMLERCGQSVAMAYDGTEAIAMVIDSIIRGRPYDLVLMDVQMPGCDGYSAARAIRAEGICADTLPIIALTANAFPGDIAAARAAGMQAHLAKPVMMADLARALQRWLPTRIVDAGPRDTAPEAGLITDASSGALVPSTMSGAAAPRKDGSALQRPISERTWQQWLDNRSSTLATLSRILADGNFAAGAGAVRGKQARELMLQAHNLAGSAAAFGEVDLGRRAAALEQALREGASREVCAALIRAVLAAGPLAPSSEEDGTPAQRRAR